MTNVKQLFKIWNDYMLSTYGDDLLLAFGPGHIVFDDDNLDDGAIEFCIRRCEYLLNDPYCAEAPAFANEYSEEKYLCILQDTQRFLEELFCIPETEREYAC